MVATSDRRGLVGRYAGERLDFISSPLVSWGDFKRAYPDGLVLSRDTGHDRDYGTNPYVRYDELESGPYGGFFSATLDNRLPAKERVVTLWTDTDARAYPFTTLRDTRVVHDVFEGKPVVIFWTPGTASALDTESIVEGQDVGASGVFSRVVEARTLSFEARDDGLFHDVETKSTWNVLGQAVRGPLEGKRLDPVVHGNHF